MDTNTKSTFINISLFFSSVLIRIHSLCDGRSQLSTTFTQKAGFGAYLKKIVLIDLMKGFLPTLGGTLPYTGYHTVKQRNGTEQKHAFSSS